MRLIRSGSTNIEQVTSTGSEAVRLPPHPANVPGPFYVEDGCCLACGVWEQEAPGLLAWLPDADVPHCYVANTRSPLALRTSVKNGILDRPLGNRYHTGIMSSLLKLMPLLLVLGATPSIAQRPAPDQPPPTTASQDVVVTGVRDQKREVQTFVEALTAASGERQLSRFETRDVCPGALGLSSAQRDAVVTRLRVVAKAAGVPLAKPRCRPNALIIITKDKHALLQSLAREHGHYFDGVTRAEVDRLLADTGPAVAWQMAGPLLNADGVEMPQSGEDDVVVNQTVANGSRITEGSRPQFAAAAVVIQADALVGLTTTQLADYGAMRVFARTDPTKLTGSAAPTILRVLDAAMDSEVPVTLTQWDIGLLQGLYRSPVNLRAAAQRAEIARRVGDRVAKPSAQ